MEIVKCSKGHFYDKALGKCPVCAREERNQGDDPVGGSFVDDYPETAPIGFGPGANTPDDVGEIQPGMDGDLLFNKAQAGLGPTEMDSHFNPNNLSDFENGHTPGGFMVDDVGPTVPVAVNNSSGFDPVVGWLVCVDGPNRGRDYRLHSGINTVGRMKKNDICIENDATISHEKDALISFDPLHSTFYVSKGDGRNFIYKNDKPVLSADVLEPYDRILIGKCTLVFVPLCGTGFSW